MSQESAQQQEVPQSRFVQLLKLVAESFLPPQSLIEELLPANLVPEGTELVAVVRLKFPDAEGMHTVIAVRRAGVRNTNEIAESATETVRDVDFAVSTELPKSKYVVSTELPAAEPATEVPAIEAQPLLTEGNKPKQKRKSKKS
jgi:hypothetical protein